MRFCLQFTVLVLLMSTTLRAGSLEIASCVLLKGETFQGRPAPRARVDSRLIPASVKPYLQATGMIDHKSAAVTRAAGEILRSLAGKAKSSLAAKDPRRLCQAVDEWLERKLPLAAFPERLPAVEDFRKAWPRASALIKQKEADLFARARVRLALLRAMGLPARHCWVRGEPHVQCWITFDQGSVRKNSKSKSFPMGRWELDSPVSPGESVDTWSLDASELPPLTWRAGVPLSMGVLKYHRAYYSLSETVQAQEDFTYFKEHGSLPAHAASRSQAPALLPGQDSGRNLIVAGFAASLSAPGDNPMPALPEVEILTPYVPHLGSWGREAPPEGGRLGVLDQAVWTDHPENLRKGQLGVTDNWLSPPPALGVVHYLSVGFKSNPQQAGQD